ncbi:MAG: electron transfer flavoprotein subunit beta/FixA family protein [Magnetococcales bacterium]|nr:electron transfer flavoprotein subunit beta/FixA family protein [Magnetococcales bacterium]
MAICDRIVVPIKPVPDPEHPVRVSADGDTLLLDHISLVPNPFDAIALEEAVQLRESGKVSEVVAVTLYGDAGEGILRTALALGADRAIHIHSDDPFSEDALTIAEVLATVVKKESSALVLAGKQGVDHDRGAVPIMMAVHLDWPHITLASRVSLHADGRVEVVRDTELGTETLALTLPALITAELRLNEPRYASLPAIMKAKRKPLERVDLADMLPERSIRPPRIQRVAVRERPARPVGERVASVSELADRLKAHGLGV